MFLLDTAYAKNKDDGRWYYFDDSPIRLSNNVYVTFKLTPTRSQMTDVVVNYQTAQKSDCPGKPVISMSTS